MNQEGKSRSVALFTCIWGAKPGRNLWFDLGQQRKPSIEVITCIWSTPTYTHLKSISGRLLGFTNHQARPHISLYFYSQKSINGRKLITVRARCWILETRCNNKINVSYSSFSEGCILSRCLVFMHLKICAVDINQRLMKTSPIVNNLSIFKSLVGHHDLLVRLMLMFTTIIFFFIILYIFPFLPVVLLAFPSPPWPCSWWSWWSSSRLFTETSSLSPVLLAPNKLPILTGAIIEAPLQDLQAPGAYPLWQPAYRVRLSQAWHPWFLVC